MGLSSARGWIARLISCRDLAAASEAPARLAVEAEEDVRCVLGSEIEIVGAQACIARQVIEVRRIEWKSWQVSEPLVGGAKCNNRHGQILLYRKMIPPFLESGARVVAPDFFGFGRSDKPVDEEVYTFDFHREHLLRLVERLDLRNLTLVVQDWGGLLGLTLPVDDGFRSRVARLIVMNTSLAVGTSPGPGFDAWRAFVRATPDLPVGALLARSDAQITPAEAAAYDAPFPDARYKAGVRAFPQLVMTEPGMPGVDISRKAERFWREEWSGPTFMAIGEADPVLGPSVMEELRKTIRGCPEPMRLPEGGHFVQERGEPIARAAIQAFNSAC